MRFVLAMALGMGLMAGTSAFSADKACVNKKDATKWCKAAACTGDFKDFTGTPHKTPAEIAAMEACPPAHK